MRRWLGTLRALLAQQGRDSARLARGVRPGRALWVLVGIAVAASAILLLAFTPIFVQRIIYADDVATADAFTAIALASLAQSGLVYLGSTLLAYITAELFAARSAGHLAGPRRKIWDSLHRLGNATSITLVIGVTGTAIGIAVVGGLLQDDTSRDTPGELGAVQLGVLLFVLLIALSYEAVRVTVDILEPLPAVWRWLLGLVFPWAVSMTWLTLLPVQEVARDILHQWGREADLTFSEPGGVVLGSLVSVAVLWTVHFLASRQPARIRAAWRAASGDVSGRSGPR